MTRKVYSSIPVVIHKARTGLTIVPFVPWQEAPAAGGPPRPYH